MKDQYDLIVVGAGPGGSIAARTAANNGLDVLLIEKRQQIGDPVRCAEGANKGRIKKFIDLDPAWISADVRGSRIYSPDGTKIEMGEEFSGSEVGLVLERKVFDRALAQEAAKAGADVMVKTRATGLLIEEGVVCGIKAEHMGKSYDIRSKIVIGADGIESKVGRWAGIDTSLKPRDMCTCAQYLLSHVDIDPDFCEFYLGREIANTGYIWVFPKGNSFANVGIGITGDKSSNGKALEMLDDFVQKHFPGGKIIELVVGGVPTFGTMERTVTDGLMLVGDAARQSDPLTGGGILNAMWAGELAGKVAANAMGRSDVSAESLQEYEREWRKELGKELNMSLTVKEKFILLSDEELNTLAHSLEGMKLKDTTLWGLLWALFKANKKILWEVRSIFKGIKEIEVEIHSEVSV